MKGHLKLGHIPVKEKILYIRNIKKNFSEKNMKRIKLEIILMK